MSLPSPSATLESGDEVVFTRLVEVSDAARKDGRGVVVVLHSPHGQGCDAVLRSWRRHLFDTRELHFEAACRERGGIYAPLREVVSRYVRTLEDAGRMTPDVRALLREASASLGMPVADVLERSAGLQVASSVDQLRFFESVGRLLAALGRALPAQLLFTDLHGADSASRAALDYLLASVFTDPVRAYAPIDGRAGAFVGTVVVTIAESDPSFETLRETLSGRDDVVWCSLRDAEQERVRRYLQSDDVVGRLTSASGGSLTALAELLEAIPGKIEDLYLRRVERVGRAERRVLEVLAVAGATLKPDTLLRMVDAGDSAVSFTTLADQRLLVRHVSRGDLRVALPSESNRLALYRSIPEDRRAVLHGRIAAVLEERSDLGESIALDEIAWHYLHSNVLEKARRYTLEAAERLHMSFAYERAFDLLGLLLPRLPEGTERADVLERLVELSSALSRHQAALKYSDAQLAVSPPSRHGAILRRQAEILFETGSYDEALLRIEAARAVVAAHPDAADAPIELVRLASAEAESLYGLGNYSRAIEVAREGIAACASSTGSELPRLGVRLTNTMGKVLLFRGEHDEAAACFASNRDVARASNWPEEEVRALFNLGTIALQRRRFTEAEEVFEQCLAFGAQTANPITRAFIHLNRAVVLQKTGRFDAALESYLSSLATFKQSGNELQLAVAALNLGTLYQTLGQDRKSAELFELAIEVTTRRDIRYFHGRALYARGCLELDRGDWRAATRWLEESQQRLGETASNILRTRGQLALARASHGAGHVAAREALMSAIAVEGDGEEVDEVRAEVDLYRSQFALADGDTETAVTVGEQALVAFDRLEISDRAAMARLNVALALAAQGATARSRSLLSRAASDIETQARAVPLTLREDYLRYGHRAQIRAAIETLASGGVPKLADARDDAAPAVATRDPAYRAWRAQFSFIVGEDPRLMQIFRMIDRVAHSDSTVLIQGPSGTGKELVAEAIHRRSARADGPLVKVNCAAFVETLLLSELFGHERGAFTGAMARRKGRFELAHGGTLFLDEIGDISPNTQVALLRVLQERTFERVGGTETVDTDVRLICASNRNLEEMVRAGTFRLDLYYRLKGVVIELPSLAERRADIPALVRHFCTLYAEPSSAVKRFSHDAMALLVRYSWPGNIRELQNFVRAILLFVEGDSIELADARQFDDFFADGEFLTATPTFFSSASELEARTITNERPDSESVSRPSPTHSDDGPLAALDGDGAESRIAEWALRSGVGLHDLKRRIEIELIRQALVESKANITQAARMLDMTRPRLSQIVNGTPELADLRDALASGDD